MKKYDFNKDWCCKDTKEAEFHPVTLPHDAMLTETRSLDSKGRHNIGWFEAQDYIYEKKFILPKSENGK